MYVIILLLMHFVGVILIVNTADVFY